MQVFLINVIQRYGYLGVFLLITLENIFPPIPSEVILTFSGFITTKTTLSIVLVIFSATIGSVVGAITLYIIGNILSSKLLTKRKNEKLLFFEVKKIKLAEEWFYKKGNKTVFFCRFIPVLRSLISIPAGMSDMPFIKFIVYTFIGSLIWNFLLIYIGKIAGDSWQVVSKYISEYSKIFFIIIFIIFLLVIFIKVYMKSRSDKKIYNKK